MKLGQVKILVLYICIYVIGEKNILGKRIEKTMFGTASERIVMITSEIIIHQMVKWWDARGSSLSSGLFTSHHLHEFYITLTKHKFSIIV